jgi:hypothetical protein
VSNEVKRLQEVATKETVGGEGRGLLCNTCPESCIGGTYRL